MTGVKGSWIIIKNGVSFDVEFSAEKSKRDYITQRQLATWLKAIGRSSEKKEINSGCDHFLYQYGRETDFSSKIILPSKDIIVIQNSLLGEFCIFVECKKYDAQNPISVGMVRSFYGTVMAEAVTAGVIMTTSYFTRDAQEFSRKIKHRMALMDYDNLVQTLNNIEC